MEKMEKEERREEKVLKWPQENLQLLLWRESPVFTKEGLRSAFPIDLVASDRPCGRKWRARC